MCRNPARERRAKWEEPRIMQGIPRQEESNNETVNMDAVLETGRERKEKTSQYGKNETVYEACGRRNPGGDARGVSARIGAGGRTI